MTVYEDYIISRVMRVYSVAWLVGLIGSAGLAGLALPVGLRYRVSKYFD
jgi:hypothetical protein